MMEYDTYSYTKKEWIREFLVGYTIVGLFLYLFYKSVFISSIASVFFALLYVRIQKQNKIQKRKWELNLQFKEGIQSVSAGLQAGYSIENAFIEAKKDMELLYGSESMIVRELKNIETQLEVNKTIEECIGDLAVRSQVEDIMRFGNMLVIGKRTGGNLVKVIQSTVCMIQDKVEMKRELQTMLASKKMESDIMCLIPPGMILYMWIGSPGFLDVMYETLTGRFFMTIGLIVYVIAINMSRKIVEISK